MARRPNPETLLEKYELLIRLVRELFDAEETCIAYMGQEVLATVFPRGDALTKKVAIHQVAQDWVDRLAATRLIANDRKNPIVWEDDVDTVIGMMRSSGAFTLELEEQIAQLRESIDVKIYSLLTGLLIAGGGDGYAGAYMLSTVMARVASERQLNLQEVLDPDKARESSGFRAEVFRRCLTPEQWGNYSGFRTDLLIAKRGNLAIAGDDPHAESRRRMAEHSEKYFLQRKREIWPNYNG